MKSDRNKISYCIFASRYSLAIGAIAVHLVIEAAVSTVPSQANDFDQQCRSQLAGEILKAGADEYVASKSADICNCIFKYPGDKSDTNTITAWAVRCTYFEGTPTSSSGQRSMNYGLRNVYDFSFSLVDGSIRQVAPNGNYGRYIQFFITQDRIIKGSPAYTIPGKPAQVVPGSPGGTICSDEYAGYDFDTKSSRYNYVCRTLKGTPDKYIPAQEPQYVPAVPDRMVTDRKKVVIDCNDKTFDISGDGKKWAKIIPGSEYDWVSSIETIVCPFIDQHQRI